MTTSSPPPPTAEATEPNEPAPDASAPEASQPREDVDRTSVKMIVMPWSPLQDNPEKPFFDLYIDAAAPAEIRSIDSVDAWFEGGTATTFPFTAPPQPPLPGNGGFTSLVWHVLVLRSPSTSSFWIWPARPSERLATYTVEGTMKPFAAGDLHLVVRGRLTSGRAWESTGTSSAP